MQRRVMWFVLAALGAALTMTAGCAKSSGTDCGNGRIDGTEQCDGMDLGFQDCASQGWGVGPLKCTPQCTFDPSGCSTVNQCGNGIIEGNEQCEGIDLGGQTCDTLNLGGGTLACGADCTFDTGGCANSAVCGNGVVEGPEQCDGFNLNGGSCLTQGYTGGSLSCDTANCVYDISACTDTAVCGNSSLEAGEECDGSDFGAASCVALGFAGGTLMCTTGCIRDTSNCTQTPEDCTNNVDDDGDGAVDCNDLDCASHISCGGSPEVCTNGVDDDQDGLIDCDDQVDCSTDPSCQTTTGEICDNGIDDDGMFGCDCGDLACMLSITCLLPILSGEFDCADGVDNDQDCLVDCADDECALDPACSGQVEICDNGADDDADGFTDCDDNDCVGDPSCPLCTPVVPIACSDSLSGNNSSGLNNLDGWDSWCSGGYQDTGPESYFSFTASSSGSVTIDLTFDANSLDLELLLVGASAGDCDAQGACLDTSQGTVSPEVITFNATAGTTYYIIVDGYGGDAGAFTLSLSCS